ncbi:hypothetical protein UFOVP119_3 [uncultured Caudovirales phage]|uniref:Uncharacterized protein n=1 Tax=uncultured Caudovirales phage TaxID=2100421 RepID=A0A6J5LFG8_9CAUD|nr:hypothetical protein UFOVP119_3 [uncultured Caudovirales phage]
MSGLSEDAKKWLGSAPYGQHSANCVLQIREYIEKLERELEVQRAVNELAYIPHRALVEQNDSLHKRLADAVARGGRDAKWRECVRLEKHGKEVWLHCVSPDGSRFGSINLGHEFPPIALKVLDELASLPQPVKP